MSQNRTNQQQGLQRQQQGGAVSREVSGTLTRLPLKGSISTTNPEQATQWIEEAYELSGLVLAPFGNSVPLMPPGYGISVTPVQVTDFNDSFEGTEIYPIKGNRNKKGLLKTILDSCATGMGFDWPPQWTWEEKFGDERDRDRLCQKVTVCGRYKDVDGSWKTLPPQTKEIDLREGSSEVLEVQARHLAKQLSDLPPNATPEARAERERIAKRGAEAELAGPRKFIRSYAQTKARLMVIGTRMRRAYTLDELKKGPFFCFRVIQTWRSDDPETQKQFNAAIIEREMGSSKMLYGEAQAPRALPPVSDEPYPEQPEQADAGLVTAPETAADPVATAPQDEQPKQCTPDQCFGPGATHVNACYAPANVAPQETAPQSSAQSDSAAWTIDVGEKSGMRVDDPQVTIEDLNALLNHYKFMSSGGNLPTEAVSKMMADKEAVTNEIERRKTLK